MDFTESPVTFILIAVNVLLSIIGFSNTSFLNKMIGWPYYEKRKHQYYRIITSGFVHNDWMHLIFNMFTFYFLGTNLEFFLNRYDLGGNAAYLALYFAGLIVSSLPSFFKHNNDPNYRSLGASGAISAVVFSVIIFSPWSPVYLYGAIGVAFIVFAVVYIIFCVISGRQQSDNINHDAHLWGSVFGLVFMIGLLAILRPDVFPHVVEEFKKPSLFGRKELSEVIKYLESTR